MIFLSLVFSLFFFFFFQAEDGIRDYKVTGVQTCALPISPAEAVGCMPRPGAPGCRADMPSACALGFERIAGLSNSRCSRSQPAVTAMVAASPIAPAILIVLLAPIDPYAGRNTPREWRRCPRGGDR